MLRAQVWERMATLFGSGRRLLELGCGTGEDAIHLARAGHEIVALDASEQMIRLARLKAAAAGCADRIEFHVMPMEQLHTLPCARKFDGVFSNFGAVNCVSDLQLLARSLAQRLVPGAPLLFVAMGRYVPWEWAWYLAHADRRRAFRRFGRDGVRWRGLTIRYPTPRGLAHMLAPMFITRRRTALGFALPPSYAAGWLERAPRALAALGWMERLSRRWTASLADHFMLEAVCREVPA
jgi:SAM-dependent methyltransferase